MGVLAEDIERKIVERARNGDRSAMKQIYDCYANYLTATCSRYLPDKGELRDVLQDSFVNIFSSLDKFTYRGEGSLKAWVTRIAANESLNYVRRNERMTFTDHVPEMTDDEEEPDIGDVPMQVLMRMIHELPAGYRTVFNLYVIEGYSHKEIGEALGISENTSRSQLQRARIILQHKIKETREKNAGQ